MFSRSFVFAFSLLTLATPVAAQDVVFISGTGEQKPVAAINDESVNDADDETSILDIAGEITDPVIQDGIAATVVKMTSAMMRLPVGQFAEAIEKIRPGTVDRRVHRDATMADLAGHDAEHLPEKLGNGSRQFMGMMSTFARVFASMMPEFEKTGREIKDNFRKAKAEAEADRN